MNNPRPPLWVFIALLGALAAAAVGGAAALSLFCGKPTRIVFPLTRGGFTGVSSGRRPVALVISHFAGGKCEWEIAIASSRQKVADTSDPAGELRYWYYAGCFARVGQPKPLWADAVGRERPEFQASLIWLLSSLDSPGIEEGLIPGPEQTIIQDGWVISSDKPAATRLVVAEGGDIPEWKGELNRILSYFSRSVLPELENDLRARTESIAPN